MFLQGYPGSYTILIEDPDMPEVYAHYAVCYTSHEAEVVANLLNKHFANQRVWIQHTYLIRK